METRYVPIADNNPVTNAARTALTAQFRIPPTRCSIDCRNDRLHRAWCKTIQLNTRQSGVRPIRRGQTSDRGRTRSQAPSGAGRCRRTADHSRHRSRCHRRFVRNDAAEWRTRSARCSGRRHGHHQRGACRVSRRGTSRRCGYGICDITDQPEPLGQQDVS
jgi:hypothetical protein